MSFATDDWLNAVEEQTVLALQEDADLGTGGALEIVTWDEELKESPADYRDVELPALTVVCAGVSNGEIVGVPEGLELDFQVEIWVTISAAQKSEREKALKEYLARVVRVMLQQTASSKQLSDLPAALDWADSGGVRKVDISGVTWNEGQTEQSHVFRGVGVVETIVSIDFQITGD
jgi:hypothetical protein|tara:strand:- start:2312 stop:2839 length:528 start_codon:yes stop_codon:yes gene_type:complete